MKVTQIQQYQQSFKGLHLERLESFHLKGCVNPYLPELKELAKTADIHFGTWQNRQFGDYFLEFAVTPINAKDDQKILKWKLFDKEKAIFFKKTLVDQVQESINLLKN